MTVSGGSRRKSDRGSTLQFWALWVWWAWLAWKLDLCEDVFKAGVNLNFLQNIKKNFFLEMKSSLL